MMQNSLLLTLTTATGLQAAQPPAPGEAPVQVVPAGTAGTAVAPGGSGAPLVSPGPSGAGQSPMGNQFFLILFAFVGLILLFSLLGQRRDRKKRDAMISAVKKHDRVQTIGGVIGSVVEIKPDYIVLKVDESSNTRITFARSAVQQ